MKEPDGRYASPILNAAARPNIELALRKQRRDLQSPELLGKEDTMTEPVLHKRPTRLLFVRFR